MSRALRTSRERISALLRVVSIVLIVMGGVFAYYVSETSLIPQLIPEFYFMAGLLIFTGLVVLIAKFED